jgi:hypothetical protein
MKRITILTIQYYRSLLLYNIAFTFLCMCLLGFSRVSDPIAFFFAKLIGFTSAVALHYYSSANTLLYYRNAGLAIRSLYVYTYAVDVFVFFVLTTLFTLCRHLF